jgi:hypothetical protein
LGRSRIALRSIRATGLRQNRKFANKFKLIWVVQSRLQKYTALPAPQITSISPAVPSHSEGRLAIVTDAGRDAVDADALLTNGAEADGEGVWS